MVQVSVTNDLPPFIDWSPDNINLFVNAAAIHITVPQEELLFDIEEAAKAALTDSGSEVG